MLDFRFPLDEKYKKITSPFGWRKIQLGNWKTPMPQFHTGMDHGCPIGTPGKVAYKGVVTRIWEDKRAGLCLKVWHNTASIPGFTVETVYYHLNAVFVKLWQVVGGLEVDFETGNSGRWITGPCFHWGLKVNGRWVDPRICVDIYDVKEVG